MVLRLITGIGYKIYIKKKLIIDQGIIGNKNTQSDRIVCSLSFKTLRYIIQKRRSLPKKITEYPSN